MSHNATTTLPTPPERIHGWPVCSEAARHFGGLTVQGHHYTIAYDEPGQPLVRSDIKAAENKAAADRIRCAFAQQALAEAEVAPQGSQGGTKP